jgi:hypothetical protein
VTLIRVVGSVSGVEIPQSMWQAFRVNDAGKATWWQTFRTEEEALEANRSAEVERGGAAGALIALQSCAR